MAWLLRIVYIFATGRFLIPIIIASYQRYWLFLALFVIVDCLERNRARWEMDELSYEFHVFRHGAQAKLLWSLLLYLGLGNASVAAGLWSYLIFFYWTIMMVCLLFVLNGKRLSYSADKKNLEHLGLMIALVGIVISIIALPTVFFLVKAINLITLAAAFSFVFEWITIVRHITQYQPGQKAPSAP